MMTNKAQRYKKLEDKKPSIIFSCNPVNYNLIAEYASKWDTSRSLFIDSLVDYAIGEYKKGNDQMIKHIDQIINAKKYAELDKNEHLRSSLDQSLK